MRRITSAVARCTRAASVLLVALAAGACGGSADDGALRAAETAAASPRARRAVPDTALLARAQTRAAELPRLRSLLVRWRDTLVVERYFGGARADRPANVKSVSKSVLSTLVGIAIARGDLPGLDATVGELLPREAAALDSAKRAITIEDLVSMRAGLQSTSFGGYGSWVSSRNWVRDALRRPMVAPRGGEGGPMIYSTGSSHLLSAILTRAAGMSTSRYYARHLAGPLGIPVRPWPTDPQGIAFGGNEMRMTPREMVAFGALHLARGRTPDGRQIVPAAWIDSSWVVRGRSPWNGHGYGYGWWTREVGPHRVHFAWGYGGQYVFVVPSVQLVVVTTSVADEATRDGAHLRAIHALVDDLLIPAAGG